MQPNRYPSAVCKALVYSFLTPFGRHLHPFHLQQLSLQAVPLDALVSPCAGTRPRPHPVTIFLSTSRCWYGSIGAQVSMHLGGGEGNSAQLTHLRQLCALWQLPNIRQNLIRRSLLHSNSIPCSRNSQSHLCKCIASTNLESIDF